MQPLNGRDAAIVALVARFKQLSSKQIQSVLFDDVSSPTPCVRALRRLAADKYLHRIERRAVGGSRGGSGQYVYALGRRGFYLNNTGRYSPRRTIDYHALAIADCFITLRKLDKAGSVSVKGFSTEPDCWAVVETTELHPDMLVELSLGGREASRMWLEIDMATEGQKQLRGKLDAYWRAYRDADGFQWPVFPLVLWLAVDEERVKELRWLISELSDGAQALFRVTTIDGFADFLVPPEFSTY